MVPGSATPSDPMPTLPDTSTGGTATIEDVATASPSGSAPEPNPDGAAATADGGASGSPTGGPTAMTDTPGAGGSAGSTGAEGQAGSPPGEEEGGAGGVDLVGPGAGGAGAVGPELDDCMNPPPAGPLLGWASEDGGTTGGGEQTPMIVSDTDQLRSAIGGDEARVVYVSGVHQGEFVIGSNKTIVGVCGAEMNGDIHINSATNVILRNLKVVGHDCSDSPGNCGGGEDAITVNGSSHLWFDHLDVSDGSDGNLDITRGSDYITISWTRFSYSTARSDAEQGPSGHRFSNLIGSSDSDVGEYRITFHHNWWAENVDQRMPRTRFGDVHVVNNLFTARGNNYCTNAGIDSHVLVQNNVYQGVNNPLSPDDNGDMRAEGNLFEATTGNQNDNGGTGFTPPYDYPLDEVDTVEELVRNGVGPQ